MFICKKCGKQSAIQTKAKIRDLKGLTFKEIILYNMFFRNSYIKHYHCSICNYSWQIKKD